MILFFQTIITILTPLECACLNLVDRFGSYS